VIVFGRHEFGKGLRAPARGPFLCLVFGGFAVASVLVLSVGAPVRAGEGGAGAARVIAECGPCHQIGDSAATGAGPSLNGIVGRKAGALADYPYSDAMREAGAKGIVWYPDDIKDYLVPGQTLVPGTAMAFGGVPGQFDRDEVVEFLATLKTSP
jgi:cytochrome c2